MFINNEKIIDLFLKLILLFWDNSYINLKLFKFRLLVFIFKLFCFLKEKNLEITDVKKLKE